MYNKYQLIYENSVKEIASRVASTPLSSAVLLLSLNFDFIVWNNFKAFRSREIKLQMGHKSYSDSNSNSKDNKIIDPKK